MAGRGGNKNGEEGLQRRPKRDTQNDQAQAQEQNEQHEKENALPEQTVYGNSFLIGAMGGNHDSGGPPADAGVEYEAVQDYGGIEDGDPAPSKPVADDGDWFRPRFRRKGQEIEPEGPSAPPEPGIPPEDADWLDGLQPSGDPWDDPAPQPPATALDDQLGAWLRALFPLAGPLPCQLAVAAAMSHDARLHDPTGSALIGVGAASSLGAAVAWFAGQTPGGRLRMQRGLAVIAAPYLPRNAARTAVQLSGVEAIPTPPSGQADPWITRLLVARLGLEAPPTPELDDPPAEPTATGPEEPLDYDALIQAELGDPPDPLEALRAAALEGCESQARWAVALRAGGASCARALADNGADPGPIVAVLQRSDQLVGQAITLLQEIAQAARRKQVPIRGLRNGLARAARLLGTAHRATVEGLGICAMVPDSAGRRPEPSHPGVELALRDGRPIPELEGEPLPEFTLLTGSVAALATADWDEALTRSEALRDRALARQDGVGVATAALIAMEALHHSGRPQEASALRASTASRLMGAGARTGVSLLARWEPVNRAEDAPIPPLPAHRPRGAA